MSALEKFTNFVLSNPVSKAIGRAVEATAEWVSTPRHVREMLKASRILDAADSGDVKTVKKWMKKAGKIDDLSLKDDRFVRMVLVAAAESGQKEVVQMMLDCGASAVGEDRRGIEPAEAALLGGHLSIVELLHKHMNDKGLPPTGKLKNAFALAQEVRTKELESNVSIEKPPTRRPGIDKAA